MDGEQPYKEGRYVVEIFSESGNKSKNVRKKRYEIVDIC